MARKQKRDDKVQEMFLSLSGVIARELSVISASNLQLATTYAQDADGKDYLVPLVDWQMIGHDLENREESKVAFEGVVPLDNLAFLINDLCSEFSIILQKLERFSGPAAANSAQVAQWMREAANSAVLASEIADRISGEVQTNSTTEARK